MKKTILLCMFMGALMLAFPQKKEDLLNQVAQLETEINLIKESNAAVVAANQQANKLLEERLAVQEKQIKDYQAEVARLSTQIDALLAQNNQYRQQIDSLAFKLLSTKSTPDAKGTAHLQIFTNATAKFTVPAGKTWYVYNVCPSISYEDGRNVTIRLKSLNGTLIGKSSFDHMGMILYSTGLGGNPSFPMVFPENTTWEFEVYTTVYDKNLREDQYVKLDVPAIINYVEYDN